MNNPDDDLFPDEPGFDPLLICVYIAALLAIFGIGLALYEIARALMGIGA